MSYPDFLVDKRVLQRNLAKGLVDQTELKKMLSKLPDAQSNAEYVTPSERGAERERPEE